GSTAKAGNGKNTVGKRARNLFAACGKQTECGRRRGTGSDAGVAARPLSVVMRQGRRKINGKERVFLIVQTPVRAFFRYPVSWRFQRQCLSSGADTSDRLWRGRGSGSQYSEYRGAGVGQRPLLSVLRPGRSDRRQVCSRPSGPLDQIRGDRDHELRRAGVLLRRGLRPVGAAV